jgi:glycerol uptake facilitator-like aquaporin
MPDPSIGWTQLISLIITNLAGILTATAFLVAVIKGGFKALEKTMDGHFTNLIEKATTSASTEAKIDTLLVNQAAKGTAALTKKDPVTGSFVHQRREDRDKP